MGVGQKRALGLCIGEATEEEVLVDFRRRASSDRECALMEPCRYSSIEEGEVEGFCVLEPFCRMASRREEAAAESARALVLAERVGRLVPALLLVGVEAASRLRVDAAK